MTARESLSHRMAIVRSSARVECLMADAKRATSHFLVPSVIPSNMVASKEERISTFGLKMMRLSNLNFRRTTHCAHSQVDILSAKSLGNISDASYFHNLCFDQFRRYARLGAGQRSQQARQYYEVGPRHDALNAIRPSPFNAGPIAS